MIGSHVAQTGLKLVVLLKMTELLILLPPLPLSAEIIGVHHHGRFCEVLGIKPRALWMVEHSTGSLSLSPAPSFWGPKNSLPSCWLGHWHTRSPSCPFLKLSGSNVLDHWHWAGGHKAQWQNGSWCGTIRRSNASVCHLLLSCHPSCLSCIHRPLRALAPPQPYVQMRRAASSLRILCVFPQSCPSLLRWDNRKT